MIFISESQHGAFLQSIDQSIHKLEVNNTVKVLDEVPELRDDISALNAIYSEYQHSIDQLRSLVTQYQELQKKARVKTRGIQLAYLRELKMIPRKQSFTKTHKPLL